MITAFSDEIETILLDALATERRQDAIAAALDNSGGDIPAVHGHDAEAFLDRVFYRLSEFSDHEVASLWVEEGCPEPEGYVDDPRSSTPAQDAMVQGLYGHVTCCLGDEDLLRLLEESLCERQSGFTGFEELMMDLVAQATDSAGPYHHADMSYEDMYIPVAEPGVVALDCSVHLYDSVGPDAAYDSVAVEFKVRASELVRLARGEVSTDEYAERVRAAIAADSCLGQEEIA